MQSLVQVNCLSTIFFTKFSLIYIHKGEEVLNPKRNIPLSIVLTLGIVSLCYCSVSFILTLMIPYYIIDPEIPIPQAFEYVGLEWAKILVSIGAIASLVTW